MPFFGTQVALGRQPVDVAGLSRFAAGTSIGRYITLPFLDLPRPQSAKD